MLKPETPDVTALLTAWSGGDTSALDRLIPLVYEELRVLASRSLRNERASATLVTTALIHEAYLRLAGADVGWENRRHFLSVAARIMRRVLVDHARARSRQKRGGGMIAVTLGDPAGDGGMDPIDIIAIDRALGELEALDERKARLVELHYFAGVSYEEAAGILGVSPVTVHRDLRFARTWLHDRLKSA
jgi:RNA polymerase sigma factor (TIGR02999 family)